MSELRPIRYAASYARKSTADDLGIEEQHEINAQRARDDGYVIPNSPEFRFSDDNSTGVNSNRAGFKRMEATVCGAKAFERVYVKSKSQFGRWDDPRRHSYYEVLFADHGAPIRYSNLKHQPSEGEGVASAEHVAHYIKDSVDNIFAAQERHEMLERVREGARGSVIMGFYPALAPYGLDRWLYQVKGDVFVERIACKSPVQRAGCMVKLRPATDGSVEIVRRVFDWYDTGMSLTGIAKRLNREGVRAPRGMRWYTTLVQRTLRRSLYVGDLVWCSGGDRGTPVHYTAAQVKATTPILYPDFVEPILDRALFERVQRRLNANRETGRGKRPSGSPYLLTGIIACSHCGAPFHGRASWHREHHVYFHAPASTSRDDGRRSCPALGRAVSLRCLEAALRSTVVQLLTGGGIVEAAGAALRKRTELVRGRGHGERVRELRRQIEEDRSAMRSAAASASRAKSDAAREEHEAVADGLGATIRMLEGQISALEGEEAALRAADARRVLASPPSAEEVVAAFDRGSMPERQKLVRALFDGVRFDVVSREAEILVRVC